MTYHAHTMTSHTASEAGFPTRFMAVVAGTVTFPARALRHYVAIKHLEQFDDHLLRDIGVERDKIPNAVCGKRWTRRQIRIPYDIVVEMSPAAKDWVRRTSPANGFTDAGRFDLFSPTQSTPFGIWIARGVGDPSHWARSANATRPHPQAALHSLGSGAESAPGLSSVVKRCRKNRECFANWICAQRVAA